MVCKFCNAEIGENHKFCPECGKRQDIEIEPFLDGPKQKKKGKGETWKLVLLIAGFVAAACVLAFVLLQALDVDLLPEQDVSYRDTYVAEPKKVANKADTVVATLGGAEMDNALLQVFCVEEFNTFFSEYYNYLGQLGLDMTKPLSEQTCYFDESLTWEQFILQASIESWQSYVLMGLLADQAGFTLDEEWQSALDNMPEDMEAQAKENNYESADALLKDRYGQTCSMEVYMEYAKLIFKANAFYTSNFEVTDAQIDAAFAQHEAEFAEKGITKTSALVSNVRHILIEPEGGTKSEDGKTTTYSDQEWADCLAKAEAVLNEWKNGNADEDSFKELVSKYTADAASKSTGGLYEGIKNDNTYMKEFQDWAISMERQKGDVGLVKTDYGYHIMYYVEGEAEWIYYSREKVQDQRFEDLQMKMEANMEANPLQVKFSKIALYEIYQVEE